MMNKLVTTAALLVLSCSTAATAATVFQSTTNGNNASVRTNWLADIGIAGGALVQDFETGFVDEQRINGSVGNGLSISGIGIGGDPKIESGSGSIGGSNPVGSFALEANDIPGVTVTLTFSGILKYLGFTSSDHTDGKVDFGTSTVDLKGTQANGNSALFTGLVFDSSENISTVSFRNVSGTNGWGLDDIEYDFRDVSTVPVPATLPLLALGLGAIGYIRRRT